jgi:hypothetical protein
MARGVPTVQARRGWRDVRMILATARRPSVLQGHVGHTLSPSCRTIYSLSGARNLMEPVYMNGAEYGRYLTARQPEFARFITDLGLAGK